MVRAMQLINELTRTDSVSIVNLIFLSKLQEVTWDNICDMFLQEAFRKGLWNIHIDLFCKFLRKGCLHFLLYYQLVIWKLCPNVILTLQENENLTRQIIILKVMIQITYSPRTCDGVHFLFHKYHLLPTFCLLLHLSK